MTIRPNLTRFGALVTLGLSTAILPACGMMQEARMETAAERAEPLSDGEIIAVLNTLNAAEIRQAELAMQKSQDPQVLRTANMIMTDHQGMDRRAMAIAGVANIQPKENPLSRNLRQQDQQIQERLRGLSGEEFNQAYLQAQTQMHQLAVETVEQNLLPAAENPQLKQMLARARDGLQQHLQQARQSEESTTRS
jgi:putative membrane protein